MIPRRYQRNYVLKTYKPGKARGGGDRLRTMLEVDAQMQAESKALAARYNARLRKLFDAGEFDRRAPQPMKLKCVDMLEASLVVFKDRPGRPCYFMEAYVEGDFVKHNGNAGYVNDRDHVARATPQAFSHFTFCETGGARLVVDVQGVGDLFTDPQVHTRDGAGFGVGNGGPRGIALFFATHRCNRICGAMGLARFKRQGDRVFCEAAPPRGAEAAHAAALGRLEAALDGEVFDDAGAAAGDAGPARFRDGSDALFAALPATAPRDPPPGAALMREAHRALGFMLLHGDATLARPSPAAALYHLAAAALGGEATALAFLGDARRERDARVAALAATRAARDARARRRRREDDAKRAAAGLLLALALYNVARVLARRS